MMLVVICTRERPKMLRRVLESCVSIKTDPRAKPQFLIVESGFSCGAEGIVSEFSERLEVAYLHQPEIGIVSARNAGIEAFLASDLDWMGSVDDDEIVSPDWLTGMLDAVDAYPKCKAFAGPQLRSAAGSGGDWLKGPDKENPRTGTPIWNVSTANAIFHRDVFWEHGLNLRFNPIFNLSGGSDTFMFFQLKDLGEDVLWVKEAECFEPMVIERSYFKARAKRRVQQVQNWGKTTIIRFGWVRGGGSVAFDALVYAVNFFIYGIAGGLLRVISKKYGNKVLNQSLLYGLHAVGYFKALFFRQGKIYDKVDGG